jgi:hypothetical protein
MSCYLQQKVMKVRVGPWESPANLVTGAVVTVYAKSVNTLQQPPNASDEVCDYITNMCIHSNLKKSRQLYMLKLAYRLKRYLHTLHLMLFCFCSNVLPCFTTAFSESCCI